MKKITSYILSIFCIFTMVAFFACGEEHNLKLEQNYIEMSIGDDFDISSILTLENINQEEVSFRAFDQNVVTVEDGEITAVGAGTTFVEISWENLVDNLEVKVLGEPLTLPLVSGLDYDTQSGQVVWNNVLVNQGGQTTIANSYTVQITDKQGQATEEIVYTNSFAFNRVGEFSISVKANDNIQNGNVVYYGSEYCQPIKVNILSAPFNITYDDETNTLSWDADESITNFKVIVNGLSSGIISTNSYVVDLTSTSDDSQTLYNIQVLSTLSTSEEDVILVEGQSEVSTFTRLYSPALSITNGYITWKNNQSGDFHYELSYQSANGTNGTVTVTGGRYELANIPAGLYTLSLSAIANGTNYLSSQTPSTLSGVEKLAIPVLLFDYTQRTLSVTDYENKDIQLEITYGTETQNITLENGKYVLSDLRAGTYTVVARSLAGESELELSSDLSNQLTIIQLPQVDLANITQSVVSGKYVVNFEKQEDLTYTLTYFDGENTFDLNFDGEGYGNVDEIFDEAKEYTITITTSKENSVQGTYYLPSQTNIYLERQSDVVLSDNKHSNNSHTISWDAQNYASGYSYIVTKNGEPFSQGQTNLTSLDLQNLEYGHYEVSVKALGGDVAGKLYLDSLNYGECSFDVTLPLSAPEIEFDRDSLIATISKVENATKYLVTLNEEEIEFVDNGETLSLDLSENLALAGSYVLSVTAQNEDELILDSAVSTITIVKHIAPNNFNVSQSGIISINTDVPAEQLSQEKFEIKIGDEITNQIGNLSEYKVEGKLVATEQIIDNTYYLDSDYSTFTVQRVQTPDKPVLDETILSWQGIDLPNFEYLVLLYQNENVARIRLNTTTLDVLSELVSGNQIDAAQDFDATITYQFTGADVVVNSDTIVYFTSIESEATTVHKIKSDLTMTVSERDGIVTATWEASETPDVTYELTIDDDVVTTQNTISYDITTYVAQAGTYTLRLKISKQGYISSEYIQIYVTRLESVDEIAIDEDENVEAITDYQVDNELQNIQIRVNDEDITNLFELSGKFDVKVKLIAKVYESGERYFLDSAETTFSFERINTLNPPTIDARGLMSFDSVSEIESYMLKIATQGLEQIYETTLSQVYIDSEDILTIIEALGGYDFTASVKAYVGAFTVLAGESHFLSSYYSDTVDFHKLHSPQNVKVEADDSQDFTQTEIKVSWDYDFENADVYGFKIDVVMGASTNSYESVGQSTEYIISNALLSGDYYVVITALGQNNYIDSIGVQSQTFTRLNAPQSLAISQNAVLTFTGANNASGYVITYTNNAGVSGQVESSSTTVDLSQKLYANAFSGNISINVYAKGNGTSTFTSPSSQTLTVTKAKEGEITLYTDKLVAGSTTADTQNFDYLITITQNNRIVKELILNYSDEYIFEDFAYQDNNQKVNTNIDMDYVVTVTRRLNDVNYILSDETTYTFTKLGSVQNLGFLKLEEGEDATIYFRANSVTNATGYLLKVGDNEITDLVFDNQNGYIRVAITNDIYTLLGSNFTFEIYAKGLIDQTGSGINYVNSSITSISGTVLPQVTGFMVSNGVLVWDKVDEAFNYALNIDGETILTDYVNNGVHTLTEDLYGRSGDFNLNIKALGNVETSLVSQNVVLDSLYTEDLVCSKLETIDDLAVTLGYISFSKLQGEGITYQGIISGNTFDLAEQVQDDTQTAFSTFYSEEMYNYFSDNDVYTLTVRAVTDLDNVLYSDQSSSIKVKLLNNDTVGSLKVTLKKLNNTYDYTQSYLTWTDTQTAEFGYNLQIDDTYRTVFTKEYQLDTEDEPLSAGTHTARISIMGSGGLDSDGAYSLNSKPAEVLTFTKLDTPTPSLTDGLLSWATVGGAGGYLLYLDGNLIVESPVTSGNTYDYSPRDQNNNITYDRYEVQAVPSVNTNYIASTKGVYTNEDGTDKQVTQLSPPDMFRIQDGALTWDINLDTFGGLGGIFDGTIKGFLDGTKTLESPFTVSMESLQDNLRDRITLRLSGSNGTYEYIDRAAYYCLLDEGLLTYIPQNVQDMLTFYGWPSLNNNYTDFGSDIPAGLYSLSINQLGNSDDQLTSNFGGTKQVYIPYAPVVELVYTDNSYVLRWDKITIPADYYSDEVKYIVYGIKETINEYEETVIERIMLTDAAGITATQFNLTELIQDGTIDESFTSFAVYVRGDNNMVLNGKVSNFITVSVLDETTAYVRNGELYWNPQQSASSYIVTYEEAGTGTSNQVVLTEAYWDTSELSSDVSYYNIYIQATGDRNPDGSTTNVVLTGPNTLVGQLTKLVSPSPVVENGIFYWDNIDNSTSYNVYITPQDSAQNIVSVSNAVDENNRISYQSITLGQNVEYTFKAMGDLDVQLSDGVTAYVNSAESDIIYATLVPSVQDVIATSGELVWDKVTNYNNALINYYRVVLQKIDNNGTPLDSEIILTGDYTSTSGQAVYSCSGLDAGRYQVEVSGYFTTSDNLGKYKYNGETAYYLMGAPSSVYTFEKYETVVGYDESGLVDNIVIRDGVLSWTYGGNIDNRNYDYELRFTTPTNVFSIVTDEETYSGAIVKELVVPGTIELEIRVVAREGIEGQGYVNSEYLQFVNVNHSDSPYIYQLDGIQDNQIRLGTVGESEDLHIIWDSYTATSNSNIADIDVQYLVTYYTSLDTTPRTKIIDTPYISTTEFNYSINESYTLYYTITVLPLGDESYVASYPSSVREIQKPESVAEVTYNATEMYFTWPTEGTSTDHVFRIKDEVLAVDEHGDIIYQNGEPVVLRTYLFTTSDNTTNRYYPVEMGAHKVSVAVVVKNSTGIDGSLTSDYTYYYDPVLEPDNELVGTAVTINLFKVTATSVDVYGGMGTSDNPYLIETSQHFANIMYRLNKPEYENSYTLTVNDSDTHVTLTDEDRYFHFKQNADLTGVAPLGANEIIEFTAIYDGDMHSITWEYDLRNISTSQSMRQYVALFGNIAEQSAVRNLRVYVDLATQMVTGSTVSLVAFENYGTIDNVVLGNEGSSLSIQTQYTISVYGVSYTNSGTISNIINYYDIDLRNTTSSAGTRANFALVGTNDGAIDMVANYADIYLQTTLTTSSGIVATNRGTVQRAVFTGDVTLNIARDNQGSIGFVFGGIVGTNNSGTISYAYAISNITIARSARATSNETVRIAGLVGSSNNGNITSAYVSVDISATTTIGRTGDIALFIANVTTVSSSQETVTRFANSSSEYSAVLGTSATNFQVDTYQTVPSGLALNGSYPYFTMNENNFPVLVFEASLKDSWGL